jgi:glycosyltransferase involved in cell wall biosynthesis
MSGGARPAREALIVANRLPFPLDDGWKVRAFHVACAVSDLVPTVFAVGGDPTPEELAAAASAFGPQVTLVRLSLPRPHTPARLIAGLVTPLPVHYWNHQAAAAHRTLAALARDHAFDLALAVTTFMWHYLRHVGPDALRLVDTHNVDSLTMGRYVETMPFGPRRAYAALTARKMRRLEARVYDEADSVWVCSDAEAGLGASIAPGGKFCVVPNGVDTTAFHAVAPAPVEDRRLLFFGRLDYYPNLDALRHLFGRILPLIRRQLPDVEIVVAGPGGSPELVEMVRSDPRARLLGRVENIAQVLEQASLVVVPIRSGGGTRLKILEALAMSRPVVTTTVGAEGLDLRPGEEIALADAPASFADEVVRLLTSPEAAHRLGRAGREAVCQRYDWVRIRQMIHAELGRALTGKRKEAAVSLGGAR